MSALFISKDKIKKKFHDCQSDYFALAVIFICNLLIKSYLNEEILK